MNRLLIDTDPGVDDALAILMAFAHADTEVLAVCGVAGNVGLDLVMKNIGAVLDIAAARNVPIYRGCDRALLGGQRDSAGVHGTNGLGGYLLPESTRPVSAEHASAAIVRLVRRYPGEVTLLAIGPLTNVAVAFVLDPGLPSLLRRLVVMGGTIRGEGNVTAAAEFNMWVDPEAAQRVFASGAPLTLVSWETTLDHVVPWDALARWIAGDSEAAAFARGVTRGMVSALRAAGSPGLTLPDPLAAAVALDEAVVLEADARNVAVELCGAVTRGQTVVDERRGTTAPPNATIVRRLDMTKLEGMFAAALRHA